MDTGTGLCVLGYFIYLGLVWHNNQTLENGWNRMAWKGFYILLFIIAALHAVSFMANNPYILKDKNAKPGYSKPTSMRIVPDGMSTSSKKVDEAPVNWYPVKFVPRSTVRTLYREPNHPIPRDFPVAWLPRFKWSLFEISMCFLA